MIHLNPTLHHTLNRKFYKNQKCNNYGEAMNAKHCIVTKFQKHPELDQKKHCKTVWIGKIWGIYAK